MNELQRTGLAMTLYIIALLLMVLADDKMSMVTQFVVGVFVSIGLYLTIWGGD